MKLVKKSYDEESYELDNVYNETDDRYYYVAVDSSIWYNWNNIWIAELGMYSLIWNIYPVLCLYKSEFYCLNGTSWFGLKSGEDLFRQKMASFFPDRRRFLQPEWVQYVQVSNCKRIPVFPPEFSVLPRKISEYLRPDSSSDANSRVMRGLRKTLNANGLCLKDVFPPCDKHRFSLRLSPYQGLKSSISRPQTGLIGTRNGLNRNTKRIIPDYTTGYIIRRFALKQPW